jgi:hypothetical protein
MWTFVAERSTWLDSLQVAADTLDGRIPVAVVDASALQMAQESAALQMARESRVMTQPTTRRTTRPLQKVSTSSNQKRRPQHKGTQ